MQPDLDTRYGTLFINDNYLARNPDVIMQIMARMVVIRCEHRWAQMDFEYTAWSPDFEIVKNNATPPTYEALFEIVDDEPIFTGFKKVE